MKQVLNQIRDLLQALSFIIQSSLNTVCSTQLFLSSYELDIVCYRMAIAL